MVILISVLLAGLISYFIWPFEYVLTVTNSKNNNVISEIFIKDDRGNVVAEEFNSEIKETLWKGKYFVTIQAEGYEVERVELNNGIGFDAQLKIEQKVVLEPILVSLNKFQFYDPTRTIEQFPNFQIEGTSILGDAVEVEASIDSKIIYGVYTATAETENFDQTFTLNGEKIFFDGEETNILILSPNENFVTIEEKEVGHIFNFMEDYLTISSGNTLPETDRGFPKQFYIYKKDHVVSLGDMVFLICEIKSYEISGVDPIFFVPLNKNFVFGGSLGNETGCYSSSLNGNIPTQIGAAELPDFVFDNVLETSTGTGFEINNLNSKERKTDVAFSYDIESGRYVHEGNKGSSAISPCESEIYSLGLEPEELICNNADNVAWFSDLANSSEENYPWVSGIDGYKEIISYSEDYGIPVTHFIVQRDYKAFKQLDPDMMIDLKEMVDEDLVEVGAHTRYHSNIAKLSPQEVTEDLAESKFFFENEFGVPVEGFRAPYHSIGDYTGFVEALRSDGYRYWSNLQTTFDSGDVEQKPYNFPMTYSSISRLKTLIGSQSSIITLAHPWNLYYDEYTISGETFLKRNETREKLGKASVLVAISDGGIPTKLKDLDVS